MENTLDGDQLWQVIRRVGSATRIVNAPIHLRPSSTEAIGALAAKGKMEYS
jgi:hypothetical protein